MRRNKEPQTTPCLWQQDEDGNYDTECGNRFVFIYGTPEDNGFKFCPYCGKEPKKGIFNGAT